LADSSKKLAWPLINSIPLCFMRSPMALVPRCPASRRPRVAGQIIEGKLAQ